MRLTELEHIGQIKDLYTSLRSEGLDRREATRQILKIPGSLDTGDHLTLWIGLADGQYARKELTLPVAVQGLLALRRIHQITPEITPGDIERRRKHYSQAPMRECKIGRPRKNA